MTDQSTCELKPIVAALSPEERAAAAARAAARAVVVAKKRAQFLRVPENALPDGWRWHVVQTEGRREVTAGEEIDKLGFAVWVPSFEKLIVDRRSPSRARRKKLVRRPVFPNYLLVGFKPSAKWSDIAHARGVTGIVMAATRPEPVPTDAVERLITAARRNFDEEIASMFKPGNKVRLTDGPFRFFTGEIEDVDSNLRIIALIDAFGRKVRLLTSEEVLELV
jgi:transcriptional antiterminator RfaH